MGNFAFFYTCKLGTGKGFQGPIPQSPAARLIKGVLYMGLSYYNAERLTANHSGQRVWRVRRALLVNKSFINFVKE